MSSPFARRLGLVTALVATLGIGSTLAAERSSATMAPAAMALLKNLEPAQLQQATFPFESGGRTPWHFIPTQNFPRKGLLVPDMHPKQRELPQGPPTAGLTP